MADTDSQQRAKEGHKNRKLVIVDVELDQYPSYQNSLPQGGSSNDPVAEVPIFVYDEHNGPRRRMEGIAGGRMEGFGGGEAGPGDGGPLFVDGEAVGPGGGEITLGLGRGRAVTLLGVNGGGGGGGRRPQHRTPLLAAAAAAAGGGDGAVAAGAPGHQHIVREPEVVPVSWRSSKVRSAIKHAKKTWNTPLMRSSKYGSMDLRTIPEDEEHLDQNPTIAPEYEGQSIGAAMGCPCNGPQDCIIS